MAIQNLADMFNNLNNMSWEALHQKLSQSKWGYNWFVNSVDNALAKYNWADKAKVQNLVNWIYKKNADYLTSQQKQLASKQNTSTNVNGVSSSYNWSNNLWHVNTPHINRMRHTPKESQYDMGLKNWYANGISTANSTFANWWKQINNTLDKYWTSLKWLDSTLWKTNSKLDLVKSTFTNKLWVINNTVDLQKNLLSDLSNKYWEKFKLVWDRLNKFESLNDSKFKEMSNNLWKIWENLKKSLNFQQWAAGSAAEKQLRWATWKGSQLRVANYINQQKMAWAKQLADLDVTLTNSKNQLTQQLLNTKKTIMQDRNMNDTDRMNALKTVDLWLWKLATWKWDNVMKWMDTVSNEAYSQLDKKEKKQDRVDNAVQWVEIQQKLEKLNQKWLNTPTGRQQMLGNTLANAWVVIPKSVENLALNTPSYLESIRIVQNYIIKSKNAWNNKLATILAAAKQNTTTTKSKSVHDAQQPKQPALNK